MPVPLYMGEFMREPVCLAECKSPAVGFMLIRSFGEGISGGSGVGVWARGGSFLPVVVDAMMKVSVGFWGQET